MQKGTQSFRSEPFTIMSLDKRMSFVLLFKQRGNFTIQLLECELKASDNTHLARCYKEVGSKYTFQTD
jgi:predicted ferric reductase